MTEEKVKLTLVFTGRRQTTKGTVGYSFTTEEKIAEAIARAKDAADRTGIPLKSMPVELLENGGFLWALKPKDAPKNVGSIYTVDSTTDAHGRLSIFPASFRFDRQGAIDTHGMITAWQELDRSVEQEKRMKSNEKRFVSDRQATDAIEILRNRYQRIPSGYRRPFFLWLLDQLEKK